MNGKQTNEKGTWEFHPGDHVRYIPLHARGDRKHADCENGKVTSTNEYYVFVRFRGGHPEACRPDQLVKL